MISRILQELSPTLIYQGMAAGVDVWSAAEAWKLGIPYVAVKPWATHKAVPQHIYDWVIQNAAQVENVNSATSYLGPWLFHARNTFMVDRAERVLAIWNGQEHGGTYHAISYALMRGKVIIRIDPRTQEVSIYEG